MVEVNAGRSANRKPTKRSHGAALAVAPAGAMALVFGVMAGCGTSHRGSGLPQGDGPVHLKRSDFSANIDNPQWPMMVGSRWVYRVIDTSDGSVKRDVIRVTAQTKMMADGIEARVVRDVVTEDGQPVEVTNDWYAQDKHGNVWYFGEDTIEYVHGEAKAATHAHLDLDLRCRKPMGSPPRGQLCGFGQHAEDLLGRGIGHPRLLQDESPMVASQALLLQRQAMCRSAVLSVSVRARQLGFHGFGLGDRQRGKSVQVVG